MCKEKSPLNFQKFEDLELQTNGIVGLAIPADLKVVGVKQQRTAEHGQLNKVKGLGSVGK